jgi:zinc D-Ala-D-Ala dipeptidase
MLRRAISKLLIMASLLLHTSAHALPAQAKAKRASDLVEILAIEPGIKLDIRYAGSNNFLGRPVYRQARAFLQRDAALALQKAHHSLRAYGFGLVVFDGYRPWSVTKEFWESVDDQARQQGFVAKPSDGSRHNRGCAVDVSLFELSSGRQVRMPSEYDEFSARAYPDFTGANGESIDARNLLIRTMQSVGFDVLYNEWWHFDFRDWKDYALMDVAFEDIAPTTAVAPAPDPR